MRGVEEGRGWKRLRTVRPGGRKVHLSVCEGETRGRASVGKPGCARIWLI